MGDFVIVGVLVLMNGLFAMSEMAIASSRKARLQALADEGSRGAQVAIELAESPNRFLATVQIFITIIGIIQGAFSGQAFASALAALIRDNVEFLAPVADGLGLGVVVVIITFISLVVGELVPKRLALQNPERIASAVSRPMRMLERAFTPFVWLLGQSTNLIIRLLGIKTRDESSVTEVEVLAMVEEGVNSGVFVEGEDQMVAAVMRFDEQRVRSLLTPRTDIVWLDLEDPIEQTIEKLRGNRFSSYPVARGNLDNIVGIVQSKDLLLQLLNGLDLNLEAVMTPPVFMPETASIASTIGQFKQNGVHTIIVLSEYGGVEGLIRMHDVIEEIFGAPEEPDVDTRRDVVNPAELTISGQYPLTKLTDQYPFFNVPDEEEGKYETVAGFMMTRLRKVPEAGDTFDFERMRFTVLAMDNVRVDRVLVEYLSHKDTEHEQS